jgi:hypothetical protein
MDNKKTEVVPGLSFADVEEIADQLYERKDGNHPQLHKPNKGFFDILENGKPDISISPIFVKKVLL